MGPRVIDEMIFLGAGGRQAEIDVTDWERPEEGQEIAPRVSLRFIGSEAGARTLDRPGVEGWYTTALPRLTSVRLV